MTRGITAIATMITMSSSRRHRMASLTTACVPRIPLRIRRKSGRRQDLPFPQLPGQPPEAAVVAVEDVVEF